MSDAISWEAWLAERYLPYLLPAAMHQAVPADVAARFMERLTGGAEGLDLLRWRSLFVAHRASLLTFVDEDLPALCGVLPSRSQSEVRISRGGFIGRPDVVATHRRWLSGDRERFVSRGRRRVFDLPEVILVRWVVERLLEGLILLRTRFPNEGDILASAAEREGLLRDCLERTPLRQVPSIDRLGGAHHLAARRERHPAFHHAQRWARRVERGLEGDDPREMAELLAAGALTPLAEAKRFELAVLLRLVEASATTLGANEGDGPWQLEHALLNPKRSELLALRHPPSGALLRFFYDQAILPPGPRDKAVAWYFGGSGRFRPDWTLKIERPDARPRYVVGEVKLTQKRSYAIQGLQEAMLYALEYADHLNEWPQAILTTSAPVLGAPNAEHPIVAESWEGWPSQQTLNGILKGLDR